ncbi:Ig-like domain-containing protein [Shewanella sp. KX20019]|uniref:Ig-like domain-containing protein n=1 Tax=Shewanella sp. KX20019 TaxID=2803864 RepID=UPI001926B2BC|nr:invasin domain 3-containing protein [Shewanella sp. KX20019]QQX80432.1 Ig-like domain-containing protein [Shewanella sp. KX20019]
MFSIFRIFIVVICIFALTACGGDDGSPVCPSNVPCELLDDGTATTTDSEVTYTVSLRLTDAAGQDISSITSVSPGQLIAAVEGLSEAVIVTFSSTIGDLPITTAVTDADGNATVVIYSGTSLGAGTITASLVTGEQDTAIFVVGATNLEMGSGDPLQSGIAEVSTDSLSAGGTANVSVTIVDEQGLPFKEAVDVFFSSSCSQLSTPLAELSSPVMLINGVATTTYLAKGCVGDDIINISANAGGINLFATGAINVLTAEKGSVIFVSATPSNIGILGSGGSESSTVIFEVLDTNGNPVSNTAVSFSLNTDVGGIQLQPSMATTNGSGMVQTVVTSGTVATTVRVTAIVEGTDPLITSQSSSLVVSTGIPDQDSFSLSAEILNPEGWNYDGEKVTFVARLADAFNNPAPNGTAVSFTTEGGNIGASCVTVSGECSVTWASQNPRPLNGRATITATAIGEESFPDSNGNGRFDADEFALFSGNGIDGQPYDMDEAFNDYNENQLYDKSALEELIDFDNDGSFTLRDGLYNGVLCSDPVHNGCADGVSNSKSINIRSSLVLIMSGSTAYGSNLIVTDSSADNGNETLDLFGIEAGQVSLTIMDVNGQQMPAGSKVNMTATAGSVVSKSSYVWPSSNITGGLSFGIIVKGEDEPNSGVLLIEVQTPNGVDTLVATIPIVIH